MLEEVIQGYEKHDLPLDTIWTDIDYMVKYEDFTIDEERFPLDRMNKILKDYHYMLIIDAGIKINGEAHTEGVKRDIFIKDVDGNNLVGVVWPGETNFVDFLHPNASQYWQDMLDILYKKVKFSGVWLDMNEPSNFVNGSYIKPKTHGFDYSKDLPYNPGIDKDP
jgi:alpha-glucosidase (family GH31 glycosyl hydrolase)